MRLVNSYHVDSGFMSAEGQFERGKHTFCVAVEEEALGGSRRLRCFVGGNENSYFVIDTAVARLLANRYGSWRTTQGKREAVLPVKDFKQVEVKGEVSAPD